VSNRKGATSPPSQSLAEALVTLRRESPVILGRDLTPGEVAQFGKYLDLLALWQKTARLVGNVNAGWIVDQLILDSLLFLKVVPAAARAIIDVGSGAGFPGVPIRIVRPDLAVTLLDSRRRRTSFLTTVVRELALENVRIVNARLEDAGAGLTPGFDAAVMRCAGKWTLVGPAALTLLRSGGVLIASGPPEPDLSWPVTWVRVSRPGGRTRLFAIVVREPQN